MPLENLGLATAVKAFLAKKGSEAAWDAICRYFRPDALCVELQSALSTDSGVKAVCSPAPRLDSRRLNEQRIKTLLQTAVTQQSDRLAAFLVEEQLVDLPVRRDDPTATYDVVWSCIARCALTAICKVVAKDAELSRTLALYAQQLDHGYQQQIIADIGALQESQAQNQKQILDTLAGIETSVTQVAAQLRPTESSLIRANNLLSDENEQLERQLREQLDAKTQLLWDDILNDMRSCDYRKAITRGEAFASQLESDLKLASPSVRGRAYLLLAQVALLASSECGDGSNQSAKAHELFQKSRQEFGDSVEGDNEERIRSFEAKLLCVDGKEDEALEMLSEASDSHAISTRLLILIDQRDYGQAASIVDGMEPDEKWCEHAAFAFAVLGEQAKATTFLEWAISTGDESLELRCRVAFARGYLMQLSEDPAIKLWRTTEAVSSQLLQIAAVLEPIMVGCRSRRNVTTGLEADAVGFGYTISRLLGNWDQAADLAEFLKHREPVHFEYALAVLREDVPADPDVSTRLRNDFPRSFIARELALAVDSIAQVFAEELMSEIELLCTLAGTPEEKDKVARGIIHLSGRFSQQTFERSQQLASQLLGDTHFLLKVLDASWSIRHGEFTHAKTILGQLDSTSDPLVDQLRARLLIEEGKLEEAAQCLESAGLALSEPDLLKQAASVGYDARPPRYDIGIRTLTDAIALSPNDIDAWRLLAFGYVQLGGYASAAECFRHLHELESAQPLHQLNWALSLSQANRPDDALEVFATLCARSDAPLRAFLARANLLVDVGRPKQGFDSLHLIRNSCWDESEFVATYMSVAYSANREQSAFEAFQQLWKLRESGKAPADILQPKTVDDLIEVSADIRKQREFLNQQLVAGKLPWLFVERLLRNVPYWGWRIRTQKLSWWADDLYTRASWAVYATNGYTVITGSEGRELQKLECSAAGHAVVADLSALLTLHRLGLLSQALQYFGQIKIPPSYLADVVKESGRLRPQQLSTLTNLESIKGALFANRLSICRNAPDRSSDKQIDEYCDDDVTSYKIRDVLKCLRSLGRITEAQHDSSMQVAHRAEARCESGAELVGRDHVVIELHTLQVLTGQGLLDTICDTFDRVSITEASEDELKQELLAHERAAETQRWHEDMWSTVQSDDRVDKETLLIRLEDALTENEGDDDDEGDDARIVALDGHLLAKQTGLPLLADDRFCQSAAVGLNRNERFATFGTDCLLDAMTRSNVIDAKTASQAFLKLMEWRYRFLVPPVTVLETLAREFTEHDMRTVSRYVHDCMRDPGLFGGNEATEPPMPIAFRFYQDWLHVIGEFVAALWLDDSVTDGRARELTNWSMTELVPTVPTVLQHRMGNVANFSAFTVLHKAMMHLAKTPDYARANLALRTIAKGLGLDDNAFLRVASDIINNYGGAVKNFGNEYVRTLQARILRHTVDHLPERIESRAAMIIMKNDLITSPLKSNFPPNVVNVLTDVQHPKRRKEFKGPFIAFRLSDRQQDIVEVTQLLLNPEWRLRRAGIAHIDRQIAEKAELPFVSPSVRQRILDLKNQVVSLDLEESIESSVEIVDLLECDFFYCMSAVNELIEMRFCEELGNWLRRTLRPSLQSIEFLHDLPIWSPGRQSRVIAAKLDQIVESSNSLYDLLHSYFALFGHLPLSGESSASGVVARWRTQHNVEAHLCAEVWKWADDAGSPYAHYHACEILCGNPEWITKGDERRFIREACDVLLGGAESGQWRIRYDLASHFCRHMELLNFGADSERIAAFAWWFAEVVGSTVDSLNGELLETCMSTIDEVAYVSREIWDTVRPLGSSSSLRSMTLFATNMWGSALLSKLSQSSVSRLLMQDIDGAAAISNAFAKVGYMSASSACKEADCGYMFDIPSVELAKNMVPLCSCEEQRDQCKLQILTAERTGTTEQAESAILCLGESEEAERRSIAAKLKMLAFTRPFANEVVQKAFADANWRRILVDGDIRTVRELCDAAIEVELRDERWNCYLPHFLASSCEEASNLTRKRELFDLTVVASLSIHCTSAVSRLLTGSHRRDYEGHVTGWRQKIDELTPLSPPWVAAKLRGMKAVLYVD